MIFFIVMSATAAFWEWIVNLYIALYGGYDYLSMLGLKLSHVSKRVSWVASAKNTFIDVD